MKLVLVHKRKHFVVTPDITQFRLGVSFIDLQQLERLILEAYAKTGETFSKEAVKVEQKK